MAARRRTQRTAQPRLLSPSAERLYARLIAENGARRADLADDDETAALTELLGAGLVAVSARDKVYALAPAARLGRLLARLQRELVASQSGLLDDYERMLRLDLPAKRASGHGDFEVVYGCERVAAVVFQVQAGATQHCRMLGMLPQAPVPQHVSCRVICAPDTEVPARIDCRVLDSVPVRMQIVDGTAVVMRVPPGTEAAVVVREPVIVTALAGYFDLMWGKAIPVPHMSSLQNAVLNLLAQGMTDATIARVLGVSPRSVRRQVAALQERAGVGSRFALGAAAVRLGWFDP